MCHYFVTIGLLLFLSGVLGEQYKVIKVPRDSQIKVKTIVKGSENSDKDSQRYFFDASIIQTLLNMKQSTTTTAAPPSFVGSISGSFTSPSGGTNGATYISTPGTVTGGGTGTGTVVGTGAARFPLFRSADMPTKSRKRNKDKKYSRPLGR